MWRSSAGVRTPAAPPPGPPGPSSAPPPVWAGWAWVLEAHLDVRPAGLAVHELAHAADVVDVAVRAEDGGQPEPVVLKALDDAARIGRGVDEDALAAVAVGGDDPAVRLRHPQRHALD